MWERVYIKRQGSIHLIEVDFLVYEHSGWFRNTFYFFLGFARVAFDCKIILSQKISKDFLNGAVLSSLLDAVFGLPYLRAEISTDCTSRA